MIWNSIGASREQAQYHDEFCGIGKPLVVTPTSTGPFPMNTLPPIERPRLSPEEVRRHINRSNAWLVSLIPERPPTVTRRRALTLTKDEKQLLQTFGENPFVNQSQARKLSGLNTDRFKTALSGAIRQDVLVRRAVDGRTGYYFEISNVGQRLLGKSVYSGKGGFSHIFWQNHLANMFAELGYKTRIEDRDCDVTAIRGDSKYCLEVTFSLGNVRENAERNSLNFPDHKTVIVVRNDDDVARAKAVLGDIDVPVITIKDIEQQRGEFIK